MYMPKYHVRSKQKQSTHLNITECYCLSLLHAWAIASGCVHLFIKLSPKMLVLPASLLVHQFYFLKRQLILALAGMEWLMGSPPVLDCLVLAVVAVDLPGCYQWCCHWCTSSLPSRGHGMMCSWRRLEICCTSFCSAAVLSSLFITSTIKLTLWRSSRSVLLETSCVGLSWGTHVNIYPVGAGWFSDNTGVLYFPGFLLSFLLGVAAFSSRSTKTVRISSVTWPVRFLAAAGVAIFDAPSFAISPLGTYFCLSSWHIGACNDPSRNCASSSCILPFVPVVGCCNAQFMSMLVCVH